MATKSMRRRSSSSNNNYTNTNANNNININNINNINTIQKKPVEQINTSSNNNNEPLRKKHHELVIPSTPVGLMKKSRNHSRMKRTTLQFEKVPTKIDRLISAILKNKGKKRRSPRKPSPRKHSPRKIFLMPSLYPNQSTNTNNNNNTTPEITYNDPGKLERERIYGKELKRQAGKSHRSIENKENFNPLTPGKKSPGKQSPGKKTPGKKSPGKKSPHRTSTLRKPQKPVNKRRTLLKELAVPIPGPNLEINNVNSESSTDVNDNDIHIPVEQHFQLQNKKILPKLPNLPKLPKQNSKSQPVLPSELKSIEKERQTLNPSKKQQSQPQLQLYREQPQQPQQPKQPQKPVEELTKLQIEELEEFDWN